ncbi:hypothetical protein MGN70_010997 [Eutypa lata]|uniref:Putative type 2a phosphatase activator tip41 protein n=1 Tax=Eutypa lata (strain UCR-EL1) TaxID=1287681 RepID=M7S859_EUTLA|nr:putative type 2a phosphatase activator tip41 protein [Eutypa lata UCREL1]KAI1247111.1 hypothetical protein MGN70_010997 [Eutypa lata]
MTNQPAPPPPRAPTTTTTTHITTLGNEPFPTPAQLSQATKTHRQGAFAITTRKLPISKAGPIEAMEAALRIPVPEMIFGDNLVAVEHGPSGWAIAFTAQDALDGVDKTGTQGLLQVAHARSWAASRENAGDTKAIMEVVRPFDWSYSTGYRGSVRAGSSTSTGTSTIPTNSTANNTSSTTTPNTNGSTEEGKKLDFAPTTKPIPLELLKRRDPILFFDEVVLYESELDDNGVSLLSAKVRVHEQRMLLLCRLFMRVDGVVVRVRDVRVYVDFEAEDVTREYTAREGAFEDARRALLMTGLRPDEITIALRDANKIAELLPIVEQTLESVSLKS